jgi:hypothetical protein
MEMNTVKLLCALEGSVSGILVSLEKVSILLG